MAVGSEEAQADQQGSQEEACDIHSGRPEWDREGSQVGQGSWQMDVPSCFLWAGALTPFHTPVSQGSWRTSKA